MGRIVVFRRLGDLRRLLLWLVILWFLPLHSLAGTTLELQYHFDRFAAHPELAEARVNTIISDQHGAVWVGTQDGLFHFDGVEIQRHRAANRAGALLDNHVLSLLIDRRGRVWIGTMQGVDRFDPEEHRFTARDALASGDWLTGVPIISLLESEDGEIWAGTADAGLYRLSEDGEKIQHLDGIARDGELSAPDTWDLQADTEPGFVWIATESGLDRLDLASGQVVQRLVPPGNEDTARQRRAVTSVWVDADGSLWLTTLAGAWRYDRSQDQFVSLSDWHEALGTAQMHVTEDGDGGLWFSSLETGVVHCKVTARTCRQLAHDPGVEHSLPHGAVRRVHVDSANRAWLATYGGLARWVPQRMQWGHYRFAGIEHGQPEIWALVRWQDWLYLGSFSHGLWRAEWPALKSRQDQVELERVPLEHPTPWSLMVDGHDRLWVSTFGGGLFRFDQPDSTPLHLSHDPDDPTSLSFDHVWHLAEDSDGVWAGTYGGGLNLLDPETGQRVDHWHPDQEQAVSSRRVVATLRDQHGRLWAATYGGGLNLLGDDAQQFSTWRHDPADPASLPHDFIADLAEGPDGGLWVATEGGGLARLVDPEAGRFKVHDESGGLLNTNLSGIRFSPDGSLWLSHKRGLQRLKGGEWAAIRVSDGLQGDHFASRSHAEPEPGWLVFGGRGGINVFAPAAVTLPAAPAAPRIGEIDFYRGQARESQPFAEADDWRLGPDIDTIALRFSSHYMDSEAPLLFRYRLDDGSWVEQRDGHLALTGLSPGRYQLELQAALEDRRWSEATRWDFSIQPPWWASPVAWAGYALAGFLLIALGVRYRLRRMAEHNRRLQARLEARNREHRLEVRAMEASHRRAVSEEMLAQKRHLFASMAHELRTPLTALVLTIDAELDATEAAADDRDRHRQSALQAIRTNVRRLARVSQQILSLSGIEVDADLPGEVIELEAEIPAIAGALRPLLAERKMSLEIDLPEPLFLKLKPGSLELILFNLIDNAWKYAGEGVRIDIRARSDGGDCLLEVADNGAGMSSEFVGQAFERRARDHEHGGQPGQGLGLAAVRAMVQGNGGRIALESAPGQGCHFSIRLPLAAAPESAQATPSELDAASGAFDQEALGTLLLVEDDPELRKLMKRLLAPDWTIVTSGDGRKALELATDRAPDLVVSDVDLPGLSGDELCRRIKSDPTLAHTPVLLVTAHDSPEQQAAGFAALADDYISKPFDGMALKARLRNLWQTLQRTREQARRSLLDNGHDPETASPFVEQLRQHAETLLDQGQLSVDNLASAFHMSPRHLGRQFARELGSLSPRNYIDQLHARRVGQRIAAGATLDQVAEELGFASSSYLGRKFRQWYGLGVREFRDRTDQFTDSSPRSD